MSLDVQNIIANLDNISSVEDPDELQKLEHNLNQLLASENPELGIDALLRVFERFPDKDGYGIFWSILHSLESLPGYEGTLVESVRRQPSEFGLLMVGRLLNSGMKEVKGTNLLSVLKEVAANERQPENIRGQAQGIVDSLGAER
jgi:hypothetical protein